MAGITVEKFDLDGILSVTTEVFKDDRGSFSETYSHQDFSKLGINAHFLQDNHSVSHLAGVIRGLHFQIEPHAQGKLIRVIQGSIYDVAVDLRRNSATFGQHISVILSSKNSKQLWIPKGFAHGFCTLEPNTEVTYKVTEYYSKECERGIAWNDPDLHISWPLKNAEPYLSEKDKKNPKLRDLDYFF